MKKKGVVFVNLGSPSDTSKDGVKMYLRTFLMDKYVIKLPLIFRWILVNLIIIPFRVNYTRSLYQKIWTKQGSPLIVNSQRFFESVKKKVEEKRGEKGDFLFLTMRYGEPSISDCVRTLIHGGFTNILIVPMYPHFAESTYLTAIEKFKIEIKNQCGCIQIDILKPFYNHPDYLSSISYHIKREMQGRFIDKLIFSFHSLPLSYMPCSKKAYRKCNDDFGSVRCVECSDCYRNQCFEMGKLIGDKLDAQDWEYEVVFQSRLGSIDWLQPYSSKRFESLPKEGNIKIGVVSPSFTVDCLETLYEIEIEGKGIFEKGGGDNFFYIGSLNNDPIWVKKVSKWIIEWEV